MDGQFTLTIQWSNETVIIIGILALLSIFLLWRFMKKSADFRTNNDLKESFMKSNQDLGKEITEMKKVKASTIYILNRGADPRTTVEALNSLHSPKDSEAEELLKTARDKILAETPPAPAEEVATKVEPSDQTTEKPAETLVLEESEGKDKQS